MLNSIYEKCDLPFKNLNNIDFGIYKKKIDEYMFNIKEKMSPEIFSDFEKGLYNFNDLYKSRFPFFKPNSLKDLDSEIY